MTTHSREITPGRNGSDDARALLAREFERNRPYLRSVAYRMLGSVTEAEDALQECWLRLDRRPPSEGNDLRPWLTTVIGRICLDMLRSRRSRREDYAGSWLPEPVVATDESPEDEAILADSVGLALLVVLETLTPAERLAFVLHDVFAMPFDEIAPVVDRSPAAARQLASRARRRVQSARTEPDADVAVQQRVVDAFLTAARAGDFEALLSFLDPDVVLRTDGGGRGPLAREPVTGAREVVEVLRTRAPAFAPLGRPAIVNGGPGIIVGPPGKVIAVVGFTVAAGRIREIDVIGDRAKLRRLHLDAGDPAREPT
ncbi:MAG: sigma-70 family RNA polymerase sigma factor [Chloroflexi bacterium]|nr:MAG: sigma-70 family RNA polymerase sigma factor [Chloroflexota bacterium]